MVSMSALEAFPLTPGEAGSVGCPLVLSDIPAAPRGHAGQRDLRADRRGRAELADALSGSADWVPGPASLGVAGDLGRQRPAVRDLGGPRRQERRDAPAEFLVIGAMKAGSTTLYEDLRGLPGVFLPEKELGTSCNGREAARAAQLRGALPGGEPGQVAGDVSATTPSCPSPPAWPSGRPDPRAGPPRRLQRAQSGGPHRHPSLPPAVPGQPQCAYVDKAVRGARAPRLQALRDPGAAVARRRRPRPGAPRGVRALRPRPGRGFADLARFLRLPTEHTTTDPELAFNAAAGNHVAVGRWRDVLRRSGYRRLLCPRLSDRMRLRLRRRLLTAVPARPAPPSAATVDLVLDELGPELERLQELGFVLPESWGREQTQRRYAELRGRTPG